MYVVLFALVPLLTAAKMVYSPRSLEAHDDWGFTACLLAALSLLALFGIRHPLKMLLLLIFEITWKAIWLARLALPLWTAGKIDDGLVANTFAASWTVVFAVPVPWGYFVAHYLCEPAEPWRSRPAIPALSAHV